MEHAPLGDYDFRRSVCDALSDIMLNDRDDGIEPSEASFAEDPFIRVASYLLPEDYSEFYADFDGNQAAAPALMATRIYEIPALVAHLAEQGLIDTEHGIELLERFGMAA